MVGGHILGYNLSWQKSIFTLLEPVSCTMIPYLWNIKVTSLFPNPSGATTTEETTNPFIVIVLIVGWQLSCTHLCKRSVSIILLLIQFQRSSTFAFSCLPNLSPIDWYNLCKPLTPPLLIEMYKIRYKTAIFQSTFSTRWGFVPSNCCQFGSNKHKNSSSLDFSYVDTTFPAHSGRERKTPHTTVTHEFSSKYMVFSWWRWGREV